MSLSEDTNRWSWRARMCLVLYVVCLVAGLSAAVVFGVHFGRSPAVARGVSVTLPTLAKPPSHVLRGWAVFAGVVLGTLVATTPILGVYWLLDERARSR